MKANRNAWLTDSVRRLSVAALAAAMACGIAFSQEHPGEHPSATPRVKPAVTLEDVAQYIESYVKQESKKGAFKIEDKQAGKQLVLALDRVHRERLSQVGPEMFFVCADFKSAEGNVYDLDFFVQGASKDKLRVLPDKTSIHKENGKERYAWKQEPVGTKPKERTSTEYSSTTGPPALRLALDDLDGYPHRPADALPERAVLLWFTNFCPGCEARLPFLERLSRLHPDRLAIFAISVLGGDRKTVAQMREVHRPSFPLLLDPDDTVADSLGISHTPNTCPLKNAVLVARCGEIVWRGHLSAARDEDIETEVAAAIETP
jgi:peroxiredoxin